MNSEGMKRMPAVKLLVVISEQDKARQVADVFAESRVHLSYQFLAEGTATSELLDMFGLGHTGKAVSICACTKVMARGLMAEVVELLGLALPGRGIAFTVPVSGATNPIFRLLDEGMREQIKQQMENEVDKMKAGATHDLVLAVINQGYSEDVMDSAKQAGATGGTVFHARRMGAEESMKFWGITVQAEKEVVAILTPRENKVALMQALGSHCGLSSEAQGIILALPVDGVEGLSQPGAGPKGDQAP